MVSRGLKDIHVFEARGQKFAFNGGTYAIGLLDDVGFNILSRALDGETLSNEEAGLSEMICHGITTNTPTLDCDVSINRAQKRTPVSAGLSSLCLNITSHCNMKCSYCFNHQGRYGFGSRQPMSEQTAKAAIDFLLSRCAGNQCKVTFFGGEPLTQFDLIKKVVAYAKQQGHRKGLTISLHVTTNGSLLTREIARFLKQHDFSIIVSLDGDEITHNYHRQFPNGQGTYQAVLKGIRHLLDEYGSQSKITLRGTYTRQQRFFSSSFMHLVNLGFEHMSIEPATGGKLDEHAIRPVDVPALREEYEDLAGHYSQVHSRNPQVRYFHISRLIDNLTQNRMTNRPCGAANSYMAVSPDGSLFPCHRIMSEKYCMGNVHDMIRGRDLDQTIQQTFHSETTAIRQSCRDCWVRNLCGGTCYAHGIDIDYGISKPNPVDCELLKLRAELAVALLVEERLADKRAKVRGGLNHVLVFPGVPTGLINSQSRYDGCDGECEGCESCCDYDALAD